MNNGKIHKSLFNSYTYTSVNHVDIVVYAMVGNSGHIPAIFVEEITKNWNIERASFFLFFTKSPDAK